VVLKEMSNASRGEGQNHQTRNSDLIEREGAIPLSRSAGTGKDKMDSHVEKSEHRRSAT